MKLNNKVCIFAIIAATSFTLSHAILIQPFNHILDESGLVGAQNHQDAYLNDHNVDSSDKDIATIIGEGLARVAYGRMLNGQTEDSSSHHHGYSAEVAELLQNEPNGKQDGSQEASLSSSVANLLMNVAQAAAAQANSPSDENSSIEDSSSPGSSSSGSINKESGISMNSRGSILELDTSSSSGSSSMPSKSDLKSGTSQWFNPKETIPVLKISSMATPSKYKKVYFRSEKKLVDGAFHSPTSEQEEKKSLMKPFNSGVQRRSSRGTSSSVAPPSVDGVVDFLKKFRDVYVQTRPQSASSPGSGLGYSASSPFASILAPLSSSSSSSRPGNFLINAINGASMLAMAPPLRIPSSLSAAAASLTKPSSSSSGSPSSQIGSAAASAVVAAASSAANAAVSGSGSSTSAAGPSRPSLTAQSYVSFWSQTFPTWVRRMLKQMRRRSLYNSNRRQQQHHKNQQSAIGQAAQAVASGAMASVIESATSGSSSSSSGSSSNSSH